MGHMGKKLQENESFIFSWWKILHSVENKDNTNED